MAEPKQDAEAEVRSPEEIQRDIEETREELADTVAAVAEKADVKTQAKRKVGETKEKAKAKVGGARQSAQAKREEFTSKAQEAAPDSAGTAGQQAMSFARENPDALKLAGAFVVGFLTGKVLSR